MTANSIQYLHRKEIDTEKWDHCIATASNGVIYGYSFYLDFMAKNWSALVYGDYELVMPLPWNKKFGLHYIYHPSFTSSLGIFGRIITPEIRNNFLNSIPRIYKVIDLDLNQGNILDDGLVNFIVRKNYVLDLGRSYELLYNNYNENIRRNIKKAKKLDCHVSRAVPIEEIIRLSKTYLAKGLGLSDDDYERFLHLYQYVQQHGKTVTYGVYTGDDKLVASCVYFFSHRRAYYILVGNHPEGKSLGASHFLIDRFIADHAGENLLLDFEGSDNEKLAFFYSSFGASVETYPD